MNSSSSSARAADLGSGQVEVAPVDHEVVEDGELGVEAVLLRHDPEPGADARSRRPQGPCRGRATRRSCGFDTQPIIRIVDVLPAPFGSEEPERLPRLDAEVDAVDRDEAAEALADVRPLDEGFGAGE